MTARLSHFLTWRQVPSEKARLADGQTFWTGAVKREGFEIDEEHQVISFVPARDDFAALQYTPIVDYSIVENVSVWCIFLKKRGLDFDAYPLIYALKGVNGWRFAERNLKELVEMMFDSVVEKFIDAHSEEITIIVLDGNISYNYIAEKFMSKANSCFLIEGSVSKLNFEQVCEAIMEDDSKIRLLYGQNFNEMFDKLGPTIGENFEGPFVRETILDKEVREAIDLTLKYSKDFCMADANKINCRNVLIIDDAFGNMSKLEETIARLKQGYAPKSITIMKMTARE